MCREAERHDAETGPSAASRQGPIRAERPLVIRHNFVTAERPLLESAKDFVVEALENYGAQKLNFAILHSVTAAELLLKERLARIHPCLILKNIDAESRDDQETVALRNLPQRLTNLGIQIDLEEAQLVRTIAAWRNQIVHHMPRFDRAQAERQLPRLLDFIARFLRQQLGVSLETFLPRSLYRTVNGLLKDWQVVVRAAQRKAKRVGGALDLPCLGCGVQHVLSRGDGNSVQCHLCGEKAYWYDHCAQCGRRMVSQLQLFGGDNFCSACLDAAADAHAQLLLDIERGK